MHRGVCVGPNVRVSPDWRKCTAYRQTGLGDLPLGLSLNEGLGLARGCSAASAMHSWASHSARQLALSKADMSRRELCSQVIVSPASSTLSVGSPSKVNHNVPDTHVIRRPRGRSIRVIVDLFKAYTEEGDERLKIPGIQDATSRPIVWAEVAAKLMFHSWWSRRVRIAAQ